MIINVLFWLDVIAVGAINLGIGTKRVVNAIKKAKEQGYVLSVQGKYQIAEVIKKILVELFLDFVPVVNLMQLYNLIMGYEKGNDRAIKYQLVGLGILHLIDNNEDEDKEELNRPISNATKTFVVSEETRKAQYERIMRNGRNDYGMNEKDHTYMK